MKAKHGQLFGYQLLADGEGGELFRRLVECDECGESLRGWVRYPGGMYVLCDCNGRKKSFRLVPDFISLSHVPVCSPVARMDIIRPEASALNPSGETERGRQATNVAKPDPIPFRTPTGTQTGGIQSTALGGSDNDPGQCDGV